MKDTGIFWGGENNTVIFLGVVLFIATPAQINNKISAI